MNTFLHTNEACLSGQDAAGSALALEYTLLEDTLEKNIEALQEQLSREREIFFAKMVAGGWKRFVHHSEYTGSHQELGEGDDVWEYLFHPAVDVSRWEGETFSHGHHGRSENHGEFERWLRSLPASSYFEFRAMPAATGQ